MINELTESRCAVMADVAGLFHEIMKHVVDIEGEEKRETYLSPPYTYFDSHYLIHKPGDEVDIWRGQ